MLGSSQLAGLVGVTCVAALPAVRFRGEVIVTGTMPQWSVRLRQCCLRCQHTWDTTGTRGPGNALWGLTQHTGGAEQEATNHKPHLKPTTDRLGCIAP